MGHADHDETEERRPPREGMFDAQLMFPTPFVEAPPPLTHVIKRDGSRVPFDRRKIADAIFRAAQTIGGNDRDRAESLASAVAIYLAKGLNGETPTADDVDDAVEKVLIEMGHVRTALAYVRYRDRRARVRHLRQGDARAILNELEEARRDRDMSRSPAGAVLFVRTTAETLTGWNRERIVEALLRETRIDEARANLIALEVEQQIISANVKTLTSALVRELVSAKLVEHGFEEHHRRHMRLGVPLYDAERIIRGPSPEGTPLDPEATNRILADAVKREFALSQVFSPEIAEAHVRGDLHIHDLGRIDRLHSSTQSLEYITRFGVQLSDARIFSKPPKYPDTLLAQMVNLGLNLQNHFAAAIHWEAVNVFFAPFLEGAAPKALQQVAQMLVYEYAYRAMNEGNPMGATEIGISWDVPSHLRGAEAIRPGARVTVRTYQDYEPTAQAFAWAIFEILQEAGDRGTPFPAPVPVVRITPRFFRLEGHESFLDLVARTVTLGSRVQFRFEREETEADGLESWEPRDVAVQRVTLNLARAAYRASSENALMSELERIIGLAARAHAQKHDFIQQLLALKSLGPLALLTIERNGRPYVDMRHVRYLVGITGLNECVQHFTGRELHDCGEAMNLALRILQRIEEFCDQWSKHLGLRCVPVQTTEEGINHRLAVIDLQEFPEEARRVIKSDPVTHDLFYTPGVRTNAFHEINPTDRVRLEGRLHGHLTADAVTAVRMADAETSHRSIADFVRKTYHHSACRQLVLSL
jgi:ribonucleoside-triphosphate reductase